MRAQVSLRGARIASTLTLLFSWCHAESGYTIIPVAMKFAEAIQLCADLGCSPASVKSAEQQAELLALITATPGGPVSTWLGAKEAYGKAEGSWYWLDDYSTFGEQT